MNDDKSNTALAVLGVVILILVISAIVVFLKNRPKENETITEITNQTYDMTLTAMDNNKRVYDVSYQFYGGNIRQAGVLKEGIIEQVLGLPSNTSYLYEIKNPAYYDFQMECLPEKQVCNAELIKYPDLFMDIMQLEEKYIKIFLYVKAGSLKEPFICVSENTMRLTNQDFQTGEGEELVRLNTPDRLRLYYDTCYNVYSKEYIETELRKSIAKEYEHDVETYNRKNRAKYGGFEEINFTDQHIRSYREVLRDGFYSFDMKFEINPNFAYEDTSNIRILVGDLYDSGEKTDIGVSDKVREENLKV